MIRLFGLSGFPFLPIRITYNVVYHNRALNGNKLAKKTRLMGVQVATVTGCSVFMIIRWRSAPYN